MNNKKSRLLLLPSLFICLFSFYAVNGQAAGNSNQLAYTQALSSDLLSHLVGNVEIVKKLPLNTRVQIVERIAAMISVQLADDPSVQGWLHQKQLDKRPLTLEKALERYERLERSRSVPAAHPAKLEWMEKAVALAPDNIDVLQKLAETLQSLGQFDRADQVSKKVVDLKADQIAYTLASSSNLRSHGETHAEIVQKLSINTPIKILQKKGDWASVQVVGNESVQGWLHRSLFARQPLSLEEALERYNDAPKARPRKLKWIERAAAIAPRDTDVLDELIKTLQFRKLNERADLLLRNVADLKADNLGIQSLVGNQINTIAIKLWNYFEIMVKKLEKAGWNRPPYSIKPHYISELVGIPIFISGPHKDKFTSDSHIEFGHYNPEFIAWAKVAITPETDAYYQATAPLFDKFVRRRLYGMLAAYHFLRRDPEFNTHLLQKYRENMANNQPFKITGIWDKNSKVVEPYVIYWLRRQIDGTSTDVKELFELIAEVYDPKILLLFKGFSICPCDNKTEPWSGVIK